MKCSFLFTLPSVGSQLKKFARCLPLLRALFVFGLLVLSVSGCATTTHKTIVGVDRVQTFIVPAATVEHLANVNYVQQFQQAQAHGALVTGGRDLARLEHIANRLIPQASVFRDDALRWQWMVMLINAPIHNATCAPGGKITFYTGLIRDLRLTDDEIAVIMGHEIAHALREHGRERLSQNFILQLLNFGAQLATKNKGEQIAMANELAHYLYELPNSRLHETEADKIGLELAARAGYDPRASLSVWQKMAAASHGNEPLEFFSTHPSHATRLNDLAALMPKVLPLYEAKVQPDSRTSQLRW